jgi:hypothetical protein
MKLLKADIKNGVSKGEAFSKFTERGGDLKKGSRFLASIPDKEESINYTKWNFGLIAIYAMLFLIGLLNLLPMLEDMSSVALLITIGIASIIPVVIIWMLFKKKAFAYLLLCFFWFL